MVYIKGTCSIVFKIQNIKSKVCIAHVNN